MLHVKREHTLTMYSGDGNLVLFTWLLLVVTRGNDQHWIHEVQASHFMGGTIRFKTDPDKANTATFYWKAGWKIGRGPCSDSACTAADVGRLGTNVDANSNEGNIFKCHEGCTDANDLVDLAPPDYWITAVNTADNYEMGENHFTHTFASSGPFKVGLYGYAWRALSVTVEADPKWSVLSTVRFGDRSDTGKPNNSPLSASLPIYNLQFSCAGSVQLPLVDPDGDKVRCRWGSTSSECGSVCSALPSVNIDEDTCTLTLQANSTYTYVSDGWYVGAIILEDFPKTDITMDGVPYTPSDALSSVPVQFLIRTPTFPSPCNAKPVFLSPTPAQNTIYYLKPLESLGIAMYAVNQEDASAAIVGFDTVTPNGVVTSELLDDDQGRPRVKYMMLYWTPSVTQIGADTVCFMATDSNGKSSEYRCIYIYSNDIDECESSPCQNGGSCNNLENIYTCDCVTGTSGYNCQLDVIDDCLASSCSSGSTCVDGINEYTCLCADGYTGTLCNIDIDECVSDPCLNGGTCTDEVNLYTCTCVSGYEGARCQSDTNECSGTPCENGGTCLDLLNDYKCLCEAGFAGSTCGTQVDECNSSPCYNGGVCTDGVDSYSCNCVSGWGGTQCQSNLDECSSSPCQNGGRCIDQVDGYTCICSNGWNGTNCDSNIDECNSSQCYNGGSCMDEIGGFTCNCTSGWSGFQCEQNINECNSSPCQNGGHCVDKVDGYTCVCKSHWNGTLCESRMPFCENTTCENGQCVEGNDTFICHCEPGYTGITCAVNIIECDSSPCQNGGHCVDKVDGYTCVCNSRWNGTLCESRMPFCENTTCENGQCVEGNDTFICHCEPGYTGITCAVNIIECDSSPCQNGSICIDQINNYTCHCPPGATGAHCELDLDECSSNPCENGGICENGENIYSCTCAAGYTGTNCVTDMNECISNPCMHNGTCVDLIAGYRCECKQPWNGENCENSSRVMCSCNDTGAWSGMHVDVICECAEDFAMSRYRIALDQTVHCLRNIYVVVISALLGVLLSTAVFGTVYLVHDLKRRYNCLLNGSDPDTYKSDGNISGENISTVSPSLVDITHPKAVNSGKVSKRGKADKNSKGIKSRQSTSHSHK